MHDPIAAALIALARDYPDRFLYAIQQRATGIRGGLDHLNRASVPEAERRNHLPRANRPDGILQHMRLVLGDN
jgi:hypothetical protein